MTFTLHIPPDLLHMSSFTYFQYYSIIRNVLARRFEDTSSLCSYQDIASWVSFLCPKHSACCLSWLDDLGTSTTLPYLIFILVRYCSIRSGGHYHPRTKNNSLWMCRGISALTLFFVHSFRFCWGRICNVIYFSLKVSNFAFTICQFSSWNLLDLTCTKGYPKVLMTTLTTTSDYCLFFI